MNYWQHVVELVEQATGYKTTYSEDTSAGEDKPHRFIVNVPMPQIGGGAERLYLRFDDFDAMGGEEGLIQRIRDLIDYKINERVNEPPDHRRWRNGQTCERCCNWTEPSMLAHWLTWRPSQGICALYTVREHVDWAQIGKTTPVMTGPRYTCEAWMSKKVGGESSGR